MADNIDALISQLRNFRTRSAAIESLSQASGEVKSSETVSSKEGKVAVYMMLTTLTDGGRR